MTLTRVSNAGLGTQFSSLAHMIADANTYSVGTVLNTEKEGFAYECVASGGDLTLDSGQQVSVLPGDNGYHVDAFGAVGDGVTDDTAAIQAASDKAGSLAGGLERASIVFRGAAEYLISSGLVFNRHGLYGNGAMISSATAGITMIHIGKGESSNNQYFENLFIRFLTLQTNPASICVQLAENAATRQASKNTYVNIQTRNGYHGFYSSGGGSANGSLFGSVFINCRALESYDWGWYLFPSTGTTTMTLIGCQVAGSLSSPQSKGFFLEASNEWSLMNCAADKLADGNALDIRNARSVYIDTFAIESCTITSSNGRLVNFSGSGQVSVGAIVAKVCTFNPGVGNDAYIVYQSSGILTNIDQIEVTNPTTTSGTLYKYRARAGTVFKSRFVEYADINTSNSGSRNSVWTDNFIYGVALSDSDTPASGQAGRMVLNASPGLGDAALWMDDGSDFRAMSMIADGQPTGNLNSISAAINTTNKFVGKPVYNTTSSRYVFATGTAAGDTWVEYSTGTIYTPT